MAHNFKVNVKYTTAEFSIEKLIKMHNAKPDSKMFVASQVIGKYNIFQSIDDIRAAAECAEINPETIILIEDFSRVPTTNQPI